eukprot:2170975-Pleurochrysis_carterae.AAC.1
MAAPSHKRRAPAAIEVDSSKKANRISVENDNKGWMGHTKEDVFELHKMGAVRALRKSYCISETAALNIYL